MNKLFSEEFRIEHNLIEEYGAVDISLVCDIPLFIDPLLIFNSSKKKYKELHEGIIKYFHFLATKAQGNLSESEIKTWFTFKEVCNNWLGYSLEGNKGSALNMEFAKILYKNIGFVLNNNNISKGKHAEKIMLLYDKSGKDKISDMTVNLIKEYLCEYTERFAKKYLTDEKCRRLTVDKVGFNYQTESFYSKEFYLPYIINKRGREEYILLTPRDMLREEEPSINKKDFLDNSDRILRSIDNDVLRAQVNNYINLAIAKYEEEMRTKNKKPKEKEINKIKIKNFEDIARENPIIYDYYIKLKEQDAEIIQQECLKEVNDQLEKLIKNAKIFCDIVKSKGYIVDENKSAKEEAIERIKFFKHVIEDCDAYKNLYYNGKRISKEDDLNRMFRFVWMNSRFKADFETNNGRWEADVVVSNGAENQCVVEFKLAKNTNGLKKVFEQANVYCKANRCLEKIITIFYFEEKEYKNVQKWINENELGKLIDKEILLIDCRDDNKQSGSKI